MLRRTLRYVFFIVLLGAGVAFGAPRASHDYYSAGNITAPTPGRVSVVDGRFDAASEQALAAWSPPPKKKHR